MCTGLQLLPRHHHLPPSPCRLPPSPTRLHNGRHRKRLAASCCPRARPRPTLMLTLARWGQEGRGKGGESEQGRLLWRAEVGCHPLLAVQHWHAGQGVLGCRGCGGWSAAALTCCSSPCQAPMPDQLLPPRQFHGSRAQCPRSPLQQIPTPLHVWSQVLAVGEAVTIDVAVGDTVVYNKYSMAEVEVPDGDIIFVAEKSILGKLAA